MLSWEFRNEAVAPTDSRRSAILPGPRHLVPGLGCSSSTSLERSVSRGMVIPYADASANSPVLRGQVFGGNFRYSLGRYFLQLLYKAGHRFKGGDHLEDSYDKALACDPVQGVSVLGLDLRDRSF